MAELEPRKIFVGLDDYVGLVRRLAIMIRDSGLPVQQVVAIARGGLFPSEVLSRCFQAPMAVVSVSSYPDAATQQQTVAIGRDLAMPFPLVRDGVWLVDELTESGKTLQGTINWLVSRYGLSPEAIRVAVLWHKKKSAYQPHYFVESVGPDQDTGLYPWFVTPQEQTELWLPRP